jgi:POT family proton-dependent oligopeptide transporter
MNNKIKNTNLIFGHPNGLIVLFLTELWERFSYYGMRALLILYLTKHFIFDDGRAGMIYGSYAALIYALPVLGGLIADRFLGMKKAVIFGAVLLVLGHLGMAIEGPPAEIIDGEIIRSDFHLQVFYFALSFIVVGVGFLKASISTLVGSLYEKDDPRRDSGFTIFYMGINIGAFIATLLCAYVGETYGWRFGFGLAGLGMIIGLITFLVGTKWLGDLGSPPKPEQLSKTIFLSVSLEKFIYFFGLMFVILVWYLLQMSGELGIFLITIGTVTISWIIWFCLKECSKSERNRILVMLFLIACSVLFWALFEQAASSLTLFTDRNIRMGSWFSAGMFQALNPFFIIIFAPIFASLWFFTSKKGLEPSTPKKFSLALIQVGLGFAVLVLGASFAGPDGKVAVIFLVTMYLLHTTGELCLSPVGLSMITKLSVTKIAGLMMGVWFLSSSFAAYVSGWIAGLMAIRPTAGETVAGMESLFIYTNVFEKLAIVAILSGIILFIVSPTLVKAMNHK